MPFDEGQKVGLGHVRVFRTVLKGHPCAHERRDALVRLGSRYQERLASAYFDFQFIAEQARPPMDFGRVDDLLGSKVAPDQQGRSAFLPTGPDRKAARACDAVGLIVDEW